MLTYQPFLSKLLLLTEFCAAATAILYYSKVKASYWKWLVAYLVLIFLQEIITHQYSDALGMWKELYFAYIGMPLEFVFLYWLYAVKSLKSTLVFYGCCLLFSLSFLPVREFFDPSKMVYSFNYTVGCTVLLLLVFAEFYKQIKRDDILLFLQNRMFYINLGVLLFYIGNIPFFGLYKVILQMPEIWNACYIYFMVSNCCLYLLFIASFLWGRQK